MHAEALSYENACQILDLWQQSPRTYCDFLRNSGTFVFLESYVGQNEETELHSFVQTRRRVPSPAVAAKFFRLGNDDLNIRFMEIVNDIVFKQETDLDICAWPYVNKLCVRHFSREFILNMFLDMHYVFDFANDETGEVFDIMYKRLNGSAQERELLAVNSFNIGGWAFSGRSSSEETVVRLYLTAQHALHCGIGEEASCRKMFLQYLFDIQHGIRLFRQGKLKEQGMCLTEAFAAGVSPGRACRQINRGLSPIFLCGVAYSFSPPPGFHPSFAIRSLLP